LPQSVISNDSAVNINIDMGFISPPAYALVAMSALTLIGGCGGTLAALLISILFISRAGTAGHGGR
jgi:hypothetical protein